MITVIYYTSNRENELFEQKIRDRLLNVIGSLPLISVSQKPIDFGQNICVGNIGVSYPNLFRQLLIGCEAAKTPFIATAEADCLYPPIGYFDFKPENIDMAYHYANLWILKRSWGYYRKKAYSLCALIAGRERFISRLKKRAVTQAKSPFDKRRGWEPSAPENGLPCINIKTGSGIWPATGTIGGLPSQGALPYWGPAKKLKKELLS